MADRAKTGGELSAIPSKELEGTENFGDDAADGSQGDRVERRCFRSRWRPERVNVKVAAPKCLKKPLFGGFF